MKMTGTFAFLLVLASCGGGTPSETRTPAESEEQRHARATDQRKADEQRDLIHAQDGTRRESEAKRLGLPDGGDLRGGPTAPDAEAIARESRAKAAATLAENNRKLCAPSQVARATEAQAYAKTWTTWFARISPHRAAIKASCGSADTTAPHRPNERPVDYNCRNLPKGVSKEDALKVLRFDSEWARANDPDYLTHETVVPKEANGASVNVQCVAYDAESDLDTQVTLGNTGGLDKLQRWKPKP